MTLLQVMSDRDPNAVTVRTTDPTIIRNTLMRRGIVFYRWDVTLRIDSETPNRDVLSAYMQRITNLNVGGRYRHIDVARMHDPEFGVADAARRKFLAEHSHAEDEVRFFAHGRACFYLHIEPRVLAVVCEAGDLLSVPAGTKHWFDMGVRPDFVAIRFFEREDGWIGSFTGDSIGEKFPTLDELAAV